MLQVGLRVEQAGVLCSAGILPARWAGFARRVRKHSGGRDALRTVGGTPALRDSPSRPFLVWSFGRSAVRLTSLGREYKIPAFPRRFSGGQGNYWVSDNVLSRGRLDRPSRERNFVELQIQSLSQVYKNGVRALDNVSLTIPQGKHGLLGPNRAG